MRIAPQSGVAFKLGKGQRLIVTDVEGSQVSDLFCFPEDDLTDPVSSGRSIDYNDTTRFTTGHFLYSNSGRKLMEIGVDTCGIHDFLVTPCSLQMFRMVSGDETLEHPSCLENLSRPLSKFGVDPTRITTSFNIFMNVPVYQDGKIAVLTPTSKAGANTEFIALTNLFVGLTACSDPGSNGGSCKPIEYRIED